MKFNAFPQFSVVLAVYKNDKTDFVSEALKSIIINQILIPNEIVLVVDGPIPNELNSVLLDYESKYSSIFNIIRLSENKGLGNALKVGVEKANNELIARMDSDDISLPDRFLNQIEFFKNNPDVDLLGGQIAEFIDNPDNIIGIRNVPTDSENINDYIKYRCPFNHMTVMFKKSQVLSVGNYQDWHFNEDYYLWIRMALAGFKFANLPDILVNVRVGNEMYKRRGGWKYFKSEAKLQKYMWNNKIISLPILIYNVSGRFIIQVIMPNKLRGYVFKKLFRK